MSGPKRNRDVRRFDRTDATVQGSATIRAHKRGERVAIDERVLMMAEAEYERQYGTSQTIDRLRERGGLGYSEVVHLLASALDRYLPADALVPVSLTQPGADASGAPR